MARDSDEVASEVAAALTRRMEQKNPTENCNYDIHLGRNNLYPMTSLPYDQQDIARQQNDILGPISLFAPYCHEDVIEEDLTPERPVTPIDDEIRGVCSTYKQLSRYVLRRLTVDKSRPYLEIEDQEALAGVLLGELNAIWTDYQKQADDPFLTKEGNIELKRLMTVRIVDICKNLFHQFIEKAQILNRRGVFTGPANVSRLKAQLGLEAHRNLSVPSIRRWATEAMSEDRSSDEDVITDKLSQQKSSCRRKSARKPARVPSVRKSPRRRSPPQKPFTLENEMRSMTAEMPTLRTEKLMSVLEDMDQLRERPISKPQSRAQTASPPLIAKPAPRYRTKRSRSLDERNRDDTLADELEIDVPKELKRSDSTHLINISCLMKNIVVQKKPSTSVLVKNDLQNLMSRQTEENTNVDINEDMPPLIQAITRSSKHDKKREKIDKQLEELKRKEEDYINRTKIRPHEKPTYPQPSTVASQLPNRMPIRASDVRVSERVCLFNFTIGTFGPLYNDLNGEVDQATVKAMDKNLFMGEEIKEVYSEIMKTMPDDHLSLSNDRMIVPAADSVCLGSVLLPSAVHDKARHKIVNKSLQKVQQPPWKRQNVMHWAKTPVTQLKEVKLETFGSSNKNAADDITKIPGMILTLEEYQNQLADCPRLVQERLTRNYQSWLDWWKSTLSSEDYQKFLVSQETDYLGYMFHHYDSDNEDNDESAKIANSRKLPTSVAPSSHKSVSVDQAQLEALKTEKYAYTPGFWNPCTVLMGGLGKDPVPEVEDRSLSPAPEITPAAYVNVGKRLRLKGEYSRYSGQSELAKIIEGKQNAALAEAQWLEEARRHIGPTPQERLEKVWTLLQMPDHLKLDMAIKYSSDQYISLLGDAIEAWEHVTNLIIERERMLSKLENFERLASDPNRFFERGYRGSSVARLEEAKQRSQYYKQLDKMENTLRDALTKMETDFQDKVSFQGRPYLDKMHWDRTEMLFWLQEERKQSVIEKHVSKGMQLGLNLREPSLQTPTVLQY